MTRDDRRGRIVFEQVSQRVPLPREEREFTAVQVFVTHDLEEAIAPSVGHGQRFPAVILPS